MFQLALEVLELQVKCRMNFTFSNMFIIYSSWVTTGNKSWTDNYTWLATMGIITANTYMITLRGSQAHQLGIWWPKVIQSNVCLAFLSLSYFPLHCPCTYNYILRFGLITSFIFYDQNHVWNLFHKIVFFSLSLQVLILSHIKDSLYCPTAAQLKRKFSTDCI